MNITLDIETIPTEDEKVIKEITDSIQPPGNYTKAETIEKWIAETNPGLVDEKIRATALDGAYGSICCVGVKINEGDVWTYSAKIRHDEYSLLLWLFMVLEDAAKDHPREFSHKFIGHNIVNFDLRFIYQRAIILGVKPPSFIPFNAKPWETDKVYDTMTQWAGVGNRVSLSKLCRVLDLADKGSELGEEFDGSMVWDAFKAGQHDKIATYCAGDVEQTYEVYKRMTFDDL